MNAPTLHTGLAQLLEASGAKSQCPDVAFFSAFIPGEHDVLGAGILALVKFRLLHPETPVLFFSFLPKERLLPKDEFGVLQVPGTEFIQLPCTKGTILESAKNTIANPYNSESDAWKVFAEKACKALLKQEVSILKHGKELQFINKVGLGFRLSIENVIKYPDKRCITLINYNERYAAMLAYFQNPKIQEIIKLGSVAQWSSDSFLIRIYRLSNDFGFISDGNNKEKFSQLKEAILRIQDNISYIEKLQPE